MATEVWSWGYTGWLSNASGTWCLTGKIEGKPFVAEDDSEAVVKRRFSRAARAARLKRAVNALRPQVFRRRH